MNQSRVVSSDHTANVAVQNVMLNAMGERKQN